jgi:hypothetical protein
MSLVYDYPSSEESDEDTAQTTSVTTSEQTRKRPHEDTMPQANDTNSEKKAKIELPELPDFFQLNSSCSAEKEEQPVATKHTEESLEKSAKSNFVPPQVRNARPNKVTEDFESWNTDKKKKTPEKRAPKK